MTTSGGNYASNGTSYNFNSKIKQLESQYQQKAQAYANTPEAKTLERKSRLEVQKQQVITQQKLELIAAEEKCIKKGGEFNQSQNACRIGFNQNKPAIQLK